MHWGNTSLAFAEGRDQSNIIYFYSAFHITFILTINFEVQVVHVKSLFIETPLMQDAAVQRTIVSYFKRVEQCHCIYIRQAQNRLWNHRLLGSLATP